MLVERVLLFTDRQLGLVVSDSRLDTDCHPPSAPLRASASRTVPRDDFPSLDTLGIGIPPSVTIESSLSQPDTTALAPRGSPR